MTTKISFEDNYVQACLNENIEKALEIEHWSEIKNSCNEYSCHAILYITNTLVPINYKDILSFSDLYELYGIDSNYRIAWVELNTDAFNSIRTIQTLLSARGIPCRIFQKIPEAKKWLFYTS